MNTESHGWELPIRVHPPYILESSLRVYRFLGSRAAARACSGGRQPAVANRASGRAGQRRHRRAYGASARLAEGCCIFSAASCPTLHEDAASLLQNPTALATTPVFLVPAGRLSSSVAS